MQYGAGMRLPWSRSAQSRSAQSRSAPVLSEADIVAVREQARELVVPGFATFDEICEAARDCVEGGFENDELGRQIDAVVREVWDHRLGEQTQWTAPGDFERLSAAFADLERNGIVARMNFTCCMQCGTTEIDDERTPSEPDENGYPFAQWAYTFFHMQDAERLGDEPSDLYLSYSAFRPAHDLDPALVAAAFGGDETAKAHMIAHTDQTVGRQVADALRTQGLSVDWNGDNNQRIRVTDVCWRKPLPQ